MVITRESIQKLIIETAFPSNNTPEVHRFSIPGWLLKELYGKRYEHLDDEVIYTVHIPKELLPVEPAVDNKPTVHLSKILPGMSLSSEGDLLYRILQKYFESDKTISVSFADTKAMSTNFFLSSFGRLIGEYGLEQFKKIVNPIEISKTKKEAIDYLIRNFC